MRLPLSLLAALLLTAAVAPAAASASVVPRSCAALPAGGAVLADTGAITVVRITSHDQHVKGSRTFGCVKPDGPVRLIGVTGIVDTFGYTDRSTTLGSVAGTYITVAQAFDTEANAGPDFRSVLDLRTGRSRQYYSGLISSCGADPTPPVAREVLGADGRLIALYAPPPHPAVFGCEGYRNPGQAQVRALRPDGQLQILDLAPVADIPPASLTLDGAVARWARAGVGQSALVGGGTGVPLFSPRLRRRCASLKGRDLAPARRLRIVRAAGTFLGCEPHGGDGSVYALAPAGTGAALHIDKVAVPVVAYTLTRGPHIVKRILSLETGTNATYWDAHLGADCAAGPRAATPPPVAIRLNAVAGLVAEFATTDPAQGTCYPNAGQALILGFDGGDPKLFDLAPVGELPPASLQLQGRTVLWKHTDTAFHAWF